MNSIYITLYLCNSVVVSLELVSQRNQRRMFFSILIRNFFFRVPVNICSTCWLMKTIFQSFKEGIKNNKLPTNCYSFFVYDQSICWCCTSAETRNYVYVEKSGEISVRLDRAATTVFLGPAQYQTWRRSEGTLRYNERISTRGNPRRAVVQVQQPRYISSRGDP